MLFFLPLLVLFGLTQALVFRGVTASYRHALLLAATFLGAGTILVTEILSVFHCLVPALIYLFWGVLFLALCAVLWRSGDWRKEALQIRLFKTGASPWQTGLAMAGLGIIGATFLAGILSAPNNWDSMTYHLSRVMHWLQNQSLAYYPTNIERQNSYLPGAEIMVLHLFVLGAGDRWVHGLQWASFLGCALGVSLIARFFGADRWGQLIAALFVITLPMAILQSVTTQNDLVLCFWVVSSVFFIVQLTRQWSWGSLLGAGLAFGLAAVTKGTFFLLIPFIVLGLWKLMRAGQVQRAGIFLLALCVLGGLVAGGHLYREAAAHEGAISSASTGLILTRRDPLVMVSNALRNVATEMALPSTEVNQALAHVVRQAHGFLGLSPEDPQTTAGDQFVLPRAALAFHEDYAGSPVHVLWVFAGLFGIFLFSSDRNKFRGFFLAWGLAGIFFLLMIKWQLWVNRFHLPLFILFAPMAGLMAQRMRRVAGVFAVAAVLYGGIVLACNIRHPFFGEVNIFSDRQMQMFVERTHLARPYFFAAEGLRKTGCRDVGLVMGSDDWEYPLWALTRREKVVFRHLGAPGAEDQPAPCVVINTLDPAGENVRVWSGGSFMRVFGSPDLAFYARTRSQ